MLYETEELPKTHDEYVKTSSSRRIEQQETVIIWFLSIVSQFPETADHDTGNHGQPGSKCSHRTQTVICQCPSSQKLQTMCNAAHLLCIHILYPGCHLWCQLYYSTCCGHFSWS